MYGDCRGRSSCTALVIANCLITVSFCVLGSDDHTSSTKQPCSALLQVECCCPIRTCSGEPTHLPTTLLARFHLDDAFALPPELRVHTVDLVAQRIEDHETGVAFPSCADLQKHHTTSRQIQFSHHLIGRTMLCLLSQPATSQSGQLGAEQAVQTAVGSQHADLRNGGLVHAHEGPPVDVSREPVSILPERPALEALEPLADVLGGPVDRLHKAHVRRLLNPRELDVLLDLSKGVLACAWKAQEENPAKGKGESMQLPSSKGPNTSDWGITAAGVFCFAWLDGQCRLTRHHENCLEGRDAVLCVG